MNNDLEQFSEERLIELSRFKQASELAALARIALLVKQAKPMAYTDNLSLETLQGNGMACMWKEGNGAEWREQIPLYTTPQPAHTEQDDTRRMDWLVSQNVEVRTPMPYGSHARFVAQCDSDDCEEYHTTLREQIDKAMFAAAPKPESE
ncbi:hypothetical protein ACP3TB_21660 (plasmid) [Rahnella variigena]|uniref:hypothetical protein n=1 Tax=Rahnella variigena TaxID=574964 RepID=UPI003CE79D89